MSYKRMETEEIKQQMMRLWKETFHDSDDYIRLVFDQYFDLENIEYEERDGQIISSLMAIPYEFGGAKKRLKGVYLCGLATQKKYQGNGIMSDILRRIEIKMRGRNYAFMFLVPAEKSLNRYYNDRGFINGFYRSELHYTALHDFKKEFFSTISKEEESLFDIKKSYFEGLTVEEINDLSGLREGKILEEMTEFILFCQDEQTGLGIYQNRLQIVSFLSECVLSGGIIMLCRNHSGEIAGLSLYSKSEIEFKEIGRYALNFGVLCKLREAVLYLGEGRNLTIMQYGYEKNQSGSEIWNPMFSTFLPSAAQVGAVGMMERVYNPNRHSEVYGMVRILSIFEILKFLESYRRDLKYSILVRLENDGKIFKFVSKNGHLESKEILKSVNKEENRYSNISQNKNRKIMYMKGDDGNNRIVLSERDLGEVLFRRPGYDRLIEEAFGLPALNGRISLLLD